MQTNNVIDIKRECYAMSVKNEGKSGNISLYGRVTDKRPVDYWTGEKDNGDYIVQSEFLEDLKNLKDCEELNISLSSVGGMVSAGLVIHNKLREMAGNGVKINCTVDGVAMSAGSLIMCAADTVKAYPSSLIMVHKASMLVYDNLNADKLRKAADDLDAYDKAIIAAYKRKTCKSEKELEKMMSAETYMTGAEAMEKGFVDEVLEGESAKISASANRNAFIVNGHILPLGSMKCPENIPIVADLSAIINKVSSPEEDTEGITDTENNTEGGNTTMATTTQNTPVVGSPNETVASEEQINAAVLAERERISKIDAIAAQFGPDIVADAKYNKPCTAEEMAYRAAVENAKKGTAFLKDLEQDASDSGAAGVSASAAPEDKPEEQMTDEERLAKAKAEISAIMGGDNK